MTARGGIDLGGTKIQAVVVDESSTVLAGARHPTPTSGGPPDVARAMTDAMREAAGSAALETASLAGVGVGSPGDVDEASGVVSSARNLPGWEGSFPLAAALEEALGARVAIGTGVGGGLVLDGKRWLGRGAAGEIGHMVVRQGGARCPCGRRGCMEAYSGRKAMEERARELAAKGRRTDLFKIMEHRGRDRLTSGVWARALRHGDQLAEELLDRAVAALGTGIASAVNLLDVEAVIIGGGLGTRLGEPYVERIAAAMQPHLFVDDHPPAVLLAGLGDLGGAIGAALRVAAAGPPPPGRAAASAAPEPARGRRLR